MNKKIKWPKIFDVKQINNNEFNVTYEHILDIYITFKDNKWTASDDFYGTVISDSHLNALKSLVKDAMSQTISIKKHLSNCLNSI